MQPLIQTLQQVLPQIIQEFNEVRLPALETAWGRSFRAELANEDQKTVEISKNYSRPLNNTMFRHVSALLPQFTEHTTAGSDYLFQGTPLEDKNSFSPGNGWVGNGFAKTNWHLLKKFQVDDDGRITHAFVALVDLSLCSATWSAKTLATNRSVIQFKNADQPHITVIWGAIRAKKIYLQPELAQI